MSHICSADKNYITSWIWGCVVCLMKIECGGSCPQGGSMQSFLEVMHILFSALAWMPRFLCLSACL